MWLLVFTRRLAFLAAVFITIAACGGQDSEAGSQVSAASQPVTQEIASTPAATPPVGANNGSNNQAAASQPRAVHAPKPPSNIGVGVAHVAGTYTVRHHEQESFLMAGALRAQELGSKTLKLFLTPDFRAKYPQPWPTGIESLTQLADSEPFRQVLALPFDTFVLTTYTFSMGTGDPWRDREVPGLLDAEAQELDELVTLLSTRYAGTGKTFVLQTWEGDWALMGATDPTTVVPDGRTERMVKWLSARHEAIATAREREARPGVTIADAVEVNRVLDHATGRRVTTDVLPFISVDVVSYSAWEALDVGHLPASQQADAVEQRLTEALTFIRAHAPAGSALMLGEMGFAENENGHTAQLVERTLAVVTQNKVIGAVYWQIFDNECTGKGNGCRGFWVLRPNGSLSPAGKALAAHWAGGK